jgi:hypothetical protein
LPRYVVTKHRRAVPGQADAPSALTAVSGRPGVTVVAASNPNVVTIDTDPDTAERIKSELAATHYAEPEVRRGLM